jgi:hypothetical protein
MKNLFLTLVCLFLQLLVFSQTEKLNCIISIDGKVPTSSHISNLYLVIENEEKSTLKFRYVLGDFILDSTDYLFLLKNKDKKATINFELYMKGKYKGDIDVKTLFDSFCVIEITNLRKGKYDFTYSSSSISTTLRKRDKTIILYDN